MARAATTLSVLDSIEQNDARRRLKKDEFLSIATTWGYRSLAGVALTLAAGLTIGNINVLNYNLSASLSDDEKDKQTSLAVSKALSSSYYVRCDDDALDTVHFSKSGEAAGKVVPFNYVVGLVAPPVMTLREGICDTLNSPPDDVSKSIYDDNTTFTNVWKYAVGLSVAIHEAQHINQIFDESQAACYTYQLLPDALEQNLPLDEQGASFIAASVLQSRHEGYPDEYYSPECRAGGAYDLGINTLYLTKE